MAAFDPNMASVSVDENGNRVYNTGIGQLTEAQFQEEMRKFNSPSVSSMPVKEPTGKTGMTDSGNPGYGGSPISANMISAGIQYDKEGRPIRNDYSSILGSDGKVMNQFSIADKLGPAISLNTQGLDELRSRALSTQPSAWARLASDKIDADQMGQLAGAKKTASQASNAAANQLRMRGGLSAGQRERLATSGARSSASATQGVINQGNQQKMQISLDDQKSKDAMLSQLPAQELQKAGFDQGQRAYGVDGQRFDITNALRDVGGLNAYNADAFGKAMQEWSAGKTADAQARAGSGGKK